MTETASAPVVRRRRHARRLHAVPGKDRVPELPDLLLAQAVPLFSGMVVTFFTAQVLGPAGRGSLTFVISTAGLVGCLLQASLHVGAVHGHRRGDARALSVGLAASGALAGAVVALGAALLLLPPYRFGQLTPNQTLVIACGAAATALAWYLTRTLQALGRSREYRDVLAMQSLIYVCLAVGAAALWKRPGPVIAVWIAVLLISALAAARRLRPWLPAFTRREGRWGELLASSLSAHAGLTGQQLLFRADIVALGLLASPEQVGIYSIAVFLAELVSRIAEALAMAALGEGRTALTPAARRRRRRQLLRLYARLASGVALAVAVCTVLLLPWALPAYSDAVPLVLILLPGVVASGSARIMLSSIIASDARRSSVIAGGVAGALSLVFLPMVSVWQATGAAIASSVLYGAQWIYCRLLVRRLDVVTSDLTVGHGSQPDLGSRYCKSPSLSEQNSTETAPKAVGQLPAIDR